MLIFGQYKCIELDTFSCFKIDWSHMLNQKGFFYFLMGNWNQLLPGWMVSDLDYAVDVVLLREDPGSLPNLLCSLHKFAAMFGMRFAPSECKMVLQDWVEVTPNLSIRGKVIERMDKFTFLGSYVTPDDSIAEELSSRIQKARLAFSNLHHLWRRNDIKLTTKGRVYSAVVRSVPLYGSETWPLKAEDIRRLSVSDHRCLQSIDKIWWEHRISNTEVRWRVLGPRNMSVIEQLHNHRLRWLGHILRMRDDRLPRRALFAKPKSSWKRPSGGDYMTWQRNMKSLTEGLSRVGNVKLAGWGPRYLSHLWLETLSGMTSSRSLWRSYTFSLALSS